jgi:hypothetical protein
MAPAEHGDGRRRQQRLERDVPADADARTGRPDRPGKGRRAILGIRGRPGQSRTLRALLDNANRYVNCGNGTVTDTVTGLIWLQNANCRPENVRGRESRRPRAWRTANAA